MINVILMMMRKEPFDENDYGRVCKIHLCCICIYLCNALEMFKNCLNIF